MSMRKEILWPTAAQMVGPEGCAPFDSGLSPDWAAGDYTTAYAPAPVAIGTIVKGLNDDEVRSLVAYVAGYAPRVLEIGLCHISQTRQRWRALRAEAT